MRLPKLYGRCSHVPHRQTDPAAIPLDIVLDDGIILVINKQPHMPVQPTRADPLRNILVCMPVLLLCPQSAIHARSRHADPSLDRVPHLGHRLDKDTSGLLLVLC